MTSSGLLKQYDVMLDLSQKMLAAATQGDWDRLIDLEQSRNTVEEALRQKDTISWHSGEAARKAGLIQTILSTDAQIKTLATSGMKELQGKLGSMGAEKKLQKAYGAL